MLTQEWCCTQKRTYSILRCPLTRRLWLWSALSCVYYFVCCIFFVRAWECGPEWADHYYWLSPCDKDLWMGGSVCVWFMALHFELPHSLLIHTVLFSIILESLRQRKGKESWFAFNRCTHAHISYLIFGNTLIELP